MPRHRLTDEQWELIKDELPDNRGEPGRDLKDHRPIIDGILWHLATGSPWRDTPSEYGPWQTVYDRFNRWSKDGTWDRILEKLQAELDERGAIDWRLFSIDGSSVRAHKSAAGAGKKGEPKNQKIMR